VTSPDAASSAGLRATVAVTLAGVLFFALATANSGGYRYGASDQAFYVPAVAMTANPALFPRDRTLFEPQMRLWLGDSLFAGVLGATDSLPFVFAVMYLVTLGVLFASAIGLARGLGASWPAAGAFLALLTLKHQITRTGANSLEGYGHPRMLAFAIGIGGLAFLVSTRRGIAIAMVGLAAIVHVTTALWFGIALAAAIAWDARRHTALLGAIGAAGAAALAVLLSIMSGRLVAMDSAWLEAIGDRAYLFSNEWPASAWVLNLGYAALIGVVYRRRRLLGSAATGEQALVMGLVALVLVFVATLPFTAAHIALAVQLQVNRVFWILDVVTAFYLAWWLVDDAARPWGPHARWTIVAALVLASSVRGAYLLTVTPARPFVEYDLVQSQWTDTMRWLRTQPQTVHVLADPQHAVRFGSSVRVAALRDTLLEAGKDPAMAIYDRRAAERVRERSRALAGFETFTTADVRALGARYNLDVFIERVSRPFELPILYRNDGFVAYDLR
jgi:hypothetical protein